MGLKVSTIARLPVAHDRDYFIYFLDYGWDEPLTKAMYDNFERMALFASENRSLVIMGLHRQEFANEVLSWHRVNGEDAKDILPAIMISDCDPRRLSEANSHGMSSREGDVRALQRFLILPLRTICKTPTDVAALLENIADDIRSGRQLTNFSVKKLIDRSSSGLSDMIVLQPNIGGVGIDIKKAFEAGSKFFRRKKSSGPGKV